MKEDKLKDISSEGLCVGCLFNKPELFDEYMEQIYPDSDFSDEGVRYFYNVLLNCWIRNGKINETSVNVYLSELSQEDIKKFDSLGGISALKRLGSISNDSIDDFKKIFQRLKTHSVLRALRKKSINPEPYYDKLKDLSPEDIIKVYDNVINKIALLNQGVNTPTSLSKGTAEFIDDLEKNPDVGYGMPFPLIESYIRGIRKKTIGCIAAHTNKGKTRILTDILTYTSVKNNVKSLLISTEQTDKEMKLQFCTSVCNNILYTNPNDMVNESDIAKGILKPQDKKKLKEAVDYFEKNNHVDFICTNIYDLSTLKNLIKQAKLKGCSIVAIDVLKPSHSEEMKGSQEWQQYSYTAEQLKFLALQLDIAILFTAQLKPDTLESGVMDFSSIANGTHIAFVLDYLLMFREITFEERRKWSYRISKPNNPMNGQIELFSQNDDYMICKIVKNRAGDQGIELILKVDRGKVWYDELGYLLKTLPKQ